MIAPETWEKAFKFCLVRNPYAQIVSSYEWWRQRASDFENLRAIAKRVHQMGSFENYVNHPLGAEFINESEGNPEHWFLDEAWGGMVDFIVKTEEIDAMIPELVQRHVPVPANLTIPRLNESQHAHYSTYYTREAMARVAE